MKTSIGKREREGYFFVLPGVFYMLLVLGYPLVYNVVLSLKNVSVKNFVNDSAVYVGVQNYIELLQDPVFQQTIKNTLVFTVACLAIQFTIGFALALFFSGKFTLSEPVRGLIMIGYLIPMSVTAMVGKNMFGVSDGVINDLLLRTGIIDNAVEWLLHPGTAMAAIIAMNCWVGIPFNMLLLTSGLTNISQEIYDSAAVEGAGKWATFIYITVPLLKSSILSVLMLGFIYTFKVFDLVRVMTNGGPLNSTEVLGTYIHTLSFTKHEFSLGAAAGMILFFCLFLIGTFYLRLTMKEDVD